MFCCYMRLITEYGYTFLTMLCYNIFLDDVILCLDICCCTLTWNYGMLQYVFKLWNSPILPLLSDELFFPIEIKKTCTDMTSHQSKTFYGKMGNNTTSVKPLTIFGTMYLIIMTQQFQQYSILKHSRKGKMLNCGSI